MELDAQSARTKLGETDERLKVVSETWFDDTLVSGYSSDPVNSPTHSVPLPLGP